MGKYGVMKKMILMATDRKKYEAAFKREGYLIYWCPFDVKELMEIKDKADTLFLCIDNEPRNTLASVGLYLRDICIDEEKMVYLYGNPDGVDEIKKYIPKLYIAQFLKKETAAGNGDRISDIVKDEVETEAWQQKDTEKVKILLVGNDADYFKRLKILLEAYFDVKWINDSMTGCGELLFHADIVMISTDIRLSLRDFMDLFGAIGRRSKSSDFHLYYLADSKEEQRLQNTGLGSGSVCFLKSSGAENIALYLIKKFA